MLVTNLLGDAALWLKRARAHRHGGRRVHHVGTVQVVQFDVVQRARYRDQRCLVSYGSVFARL